MQPLQTGKMVRRVLVVVPNWVGDVVLATPTLAALRAHWQRARISYLLRRYVSEVVEGCGWHDNLIYWPPAGGVWGAWRTFNLAGRLRAERFDLALLLTNSFRAALTVRLAGIPRRVGYAREGRGWLLSERLRPAKHNGEYLPGSVLPYYAHVAEQVGCRVADRMPRLGLSSAQERGGTELLEHYKLTPGEYALINPGARFGAAKCWPPERFAEVCDRLARETHLTPVIVGAPGEYPLMRDIAGRAHEPVLCCDDPGTTLGTLKPLVRSAALLVCNDTGPRHYGIALGVPTVTIFGPTHQEWTDTGYRDEIKLQATVACGPCQLPKCPLDLRCMHAVSTDMVMRAITELLRRRGTPAPSTAE